MLGGTMGAAHVGISMYGGIAVMLDDFVECSMDVQQRESDECLKAG